MIKGLIPVSRELRQQHPSELLSSSVMFWERSSRNVPCDMNWSAVLSNPCEPHGLCFVWIVQFALHAEPMKLSWHLGWYDLRVPFYKNACVDNFPLFQARRNKGQWQPGNTAHTCTDHNGNNNIFVSNHAFRCWTSVRQVQGSIYVCDQPRRDDVTM